MPTECNGQAFDSQPPSRRKATARFDGGTMTSPPAARWFDETGAVGSAGPRQAASRQEYANRLELTPATAKSRTNSQSRLCVSKR